MIKAEHDKLIEEKIEFIRQDLIENQVELDEDAKKVLYENRWELYQ